MDRHTARHFPYRNEDGCFLKCSGQCEKENCADCEKLCAAVQRLGQYEDMIERGQLKNLRWIPVTERLPEPFKRVIVARPGEDETIVEQGYKDVGPWWKVYGTRTKYVTHWMDFPKSPKENAP